MRSLLTITVIATIIGTAGCGKSTQSKGERLQLEFWTERNAGSYVGDRGSWAVVVKPNETSGAWELSAFNVDSRGTVKLDRDALSSAFAEAKRVNQNGNRPVTLDEFHVRITYASESTSQVLIWSGDQELIMHAFKACPHLEAMHAQVAGSELTKGYWFRHFEPVASGAAWDGSTTGPDTIDLNSLSNMTLEERAKMREKTGNR